MRPLGVTMLAAGYSEETGPELFLCDPSGCVWLFFVVVVVLSCVLYRSLTFLVTLGHLGTPCRSYYAGHRACAAGAKDQEAVNYLEKRIARGDEAEGCVAAWLH
jgi:20S proteasome subunit alpha 1